MKQRSSEGITSLIKYYFWHWLIFILLIILFSYAVRAQVGSSDVIWESVDLKGSNCTQGLDSSSVFNEYSASFLFDKLNLSLPRATTTGSSKYDTDPIISSIRAGSRALDYKVCNVEIALRPPVGYKIIAYNLLLEYRGAISASKGYVIHFRSIFSHLLKAYSGIGDRPGASFPIADQRISITDNPEWKIVAKKRIPVEQNCQTADNLRKIQIKTFIALSQPNKLTVDPNKYASIVIDGLDMSGAGSANPSVPQLQIAAELAPCR